MGPYKNEAEIVVFGPGVGESILIHIGDGLWVIVDSCIEKESGKPAAMRYLESIGVDKNNVTRIIVSHWHNDHIRGMTQLVEEYQNAKFYIPQAMAEKDFFTIASLNTDFVSKDLNIVAELHDSVEYIFENDASRLKYLIEDITVYSDDTGQFPVSIYALSPSQLSYTKYVEFLKGLVAKPSDERLVPEILKKIDNHHCCALWVQLGEVSILLGSYLENQKDDNLGWNGILNNQNKPNDQANIFKVAHHGSKGAHNESVIKEMLSDNVISIVTPFSSHKLPRDDAKEKIKNYSSKAYLTAKQSGKKVKDKDKLVDKLARQHLKNRTKINFEYCYVKLRGKVDDNVENWSVDLENSAHQL